MRPMNEAWAWDADAQRITLFGGENENTLWEFDGTHWRSLAAGQSPKESSLLGQQLFYDTVHHRLTIFDGSALWQYLR